MSSAADILASFDFIPKDSSRETYSSSSFLPQPPPRSHLNLLIQERWQGRGEGNPARKGPPRDAGVPLCIMWIAQALACLADAVERMPDAAFLAEHQAAHDAPRSASVDLVAEPGDEP